MFSPLSGTEPKLWMNMTFFMREKKMYMKHSVTYTIYNHVLIALDIRCYKQMDLMNLRKWEEKKKTS